MPNWCENDLFVFGTKEKIEEFRDKLKKVDGDSVTWLHEEPLIPYPKEFAEKDAKLEQWREANPGHFFGKDAPEDGFNHGGYEWCNEHWGTKWGFRQVNEPRMEFDDSHASLEYHFSTAWEPPEPLVEKMGELFPNLTFRLTYFEGGVGFNGILLIENGKVTLKESGSYYGDRGG